MSTAKSNWMNISDREKTTLPIVISLLVLAAILRAQPHMSNVTPFFAVSILAGFILGRDRAVLAGVLSALAMFIGDLMIELHWSMLFVYAGVAMAALMGSMGTDLLAKPRTGFVKQVLGAFVMAGLASTVFFVISNLGVWLVGGLYPRTGEGLVQCFVMAIPFFTKSLAADLFFGTIFVAVAARLMASRVAAATETNAKVIHGR